jgi:hypothetical protein
VKLSDQPSFPEVATEDVPKEAVQPGKHRREENQIHAPNWML